MTSRDFCYWFQGFMEISEAKELSEKQVEIIKRHLAMVFHHEIDPSFGKDKKPLTEIHDGTRTDQVFWDPATLKFSC